MLKVGFDLRKCLRGGAVGISLSLSLGDLAQQMKADRSCHHSFPAQLLHHSVQTLDLEHGSGMNRSHAEL